VETEPEALLAFARSSYRRSSRERRRPCTSAAPHILCSRSISPVLRVKKIPRVETGGIVNEEETVNRVNVRAGSGGLVPRAAVSAPQYKDAGSHRICL